MIDHPHASQRFHLRTFFERGVVALILPNGETETEKSLIIYGVRWAPYFAFEYLD